MPGRKQVHEALDLDTTTPLEKYLSHAEYNPLQSNFWTEHSHSKELLVLEKFEFFKILVSGRKKSFAKHLSRMENNYLQSR